MTNEVKKQQPGTVVPFSDQNFFQIYGEATRQTAIVGKLLKFSKGDWMAGESNEPIENGSQFIANMDELLVGWVRWSNNKPTDHVMGKVAVGYQPPRRNELGDTDQDAWDVGEDGQARDPWQFTNYLLLQDGSGDLYTFTTSSTGGRNAIGDLCIKYGKQMRQHTNEYPIIELGVGSYMHSNKAFGRIKYPTLTIAGWAPKDDFADVASVDRSGEVEDEEETQEAQAGPPSKPAPAKAPPAKTPAKPAPKAKGKTRF
jgi:hypothetical protein